MVLCFRDDELQDSLSNGTSPLLVRFNKINNQSPCQQGLLSRLGGSEQTFQWGWMGLTYPNCVGI